MLNKLAIILVIQPKVFLKDIFLRKWTLKMYYKMMFIIMNEINNLCFRSCPIFLYVLADFAWMFTDADKENPVTAEDKERNIEDEEVDEDDEEEEEFPAPPPPEDLAKLSMEAQFKVCFSIQR